MYPSHPSPLNSSTLQSAPSNNNNNTKRKNRSRFAGTRRFSHNTVPSKTLFVNQHKQHRLRQTSRGLGKSQISNDFSATTVAKTTLHVSSQRTDNFKLCCSIKMKRTRRGGEGGRLKLCPGMTTSSLVRRKSSLFGVNPTLCCATRTTRAACDRCNNYPCACYALILRVLTLASVIAVGGHNSAPVISLSNYSPVAPIIPDKRNRSITGQWRARALSCCRSRAIVSAPVMTALLIPTYHYLSSPSISSFEMGDAAQISATRTPLFPYLSSTEDG